MRTFGFKLVTRRGSAVGAAGVGIITAVMFAATLIGEEAEGSQPLPPPEGRMPSYSKLPWACSSCCRRTWRPRRFRSRRIV